MMSAEATTTKVDGDTKRVPPSLRSNDDSSVDIINVIRARIRSQVFDYASMIPLKVVERALMKPVLLIRGRTDNSNSQTSSLALSFQERVHLTQDRLIEHVVQRTSARNDAYVHSSQNNKNSDDDGYCKKIRREDLERIVLNGGEGDENIFTNTTKNEHGQEENDIKRNARNGGQSSSRAMKNLKCILDAYEATKTTILPKGRRSISKADKEDKDDDDKTMTTTADDDDDDDNDDDDDGLIRIDFFCLFLFVHGINLPSAKSPMRANTDWYNDSQNMTNENNNNNNERDEKEFVRMKFLITHWNDIKTICTKADDLIDSPELLVSDRAWECFRYVFQFYDEKKLIEIENKEAKKRLETIQSVYLLLEDSLSASSSSSSLPHTTTITQNHFSNVSFVKPFELCVENLKKETFARELVQSSKNSLELISSCFISNCSESAIYIMAPVQHVRIDNVVDCCIFIGSVSSTIFLTRCERVNVVSASKYLFSKASHDCSFNVAVGVQPIFVGDSRGCVVGPYNSYYGDLSVHLKKCRLQPESIEMTESWKNSRIISTNPDPDSGSESDSETYNHHHHHHHHQVGLGGLGSGGNFSIRVQKPEDFAPFIVPFLPVEVAAGTTTLLEHAHDLAPSSSTASVSLASNTHFEITRANPFRIPGEYVTSLDDKNELVSVFRKEMAEKISSGSDSDKVTLIQKEFRDWLKQTGKARHIGDLIKIERQSSSSSSS